MMGRIFGGVLFLWSVCVQGVFAQEGMISIALKGNLTTSSRLFTDPNSPDIVERSQYLALEDFFGYGVELRYQIPESNIALGLSADYVRAKSNRSITIVSTPVPVEDGYRVVPVELTGYFLIPLSGPTFGVYMGGGVGAYFGSRVYKVGDTDAQTTSAENGYGIHVLGGLSYRFTGWFSLEAEMKFRDLQFKTSNQFSSSTVTYNGVVIPVGQLDASIHTDGVIFQVGTVFNF
jgi:hypothetical protein